MIPEYNEFDSVERKGITEVAEMFNLNMQTIRKYEEDFDIYIPRDGADKRYYTETQIKILRLIVELKERGLVKDQIKEILKKNVDYIEQKATEIEQVTMDKLKVADFKDLLFQSIADVISVREEALVEEFKAHLDNMKIEMEEAYNKKVDGIRDEIQKEFEQQGKQRSAENMKLMNYLEESRKDKKGTILSRLFGKKE